MHFPFYNCTHPDAEAILTMGPGEAKIEIKKHPESQGFGGRIVGIETVDKMTDHQIEAKFHSTLQDGVCQ